MPRGSKKRETSIPSEDRLYYRIGEVSRITGIKPHVLRYWESEFKMIKPYKGSSLQRLYRRKDLELILKIKKLLYEEGFTIAGARKRIRDMEKEEMKKAKFQEAEKRTNGTNHELLLRIREELDGIRKMLG